MQDFHLHISKFIDKYHLQYIQRNIVMYYLIVSIFLRKRVATKQAKNAWAESISSHEKFFVHPKYKKEHAQ